MGRRRLTPPPVRPSSFVERVVAASWPTLAPRGEFTTALSSRPGKVINLPQPADPQHREIRFVVLAPAIVLVVLSGGADSDGSLSIALSLRALVRALAATSVAFTRSLCLPSSSAWRRSPWQSPRLQADGFTIVAMVVVVLQQQRNHATVALQQTFAVVKIKQRYFVPFLANKR